MIFKQEMEKRGIDIFGTSLYKNGEHLLTFKPKEFFEMTPRELLEYIDKELNKYESGTSKHKSMAQEQPDKN